MPRKKSPVTGDRSRDPPTSSAVPLRHPRIPRPLNSTLGLSLISYYLRRKMYLPSKCEVVHIMENLHDHEDVGESGINAPPIQLSAEVLSIG